MRMSPDELVAELQPQPNGPLSVWMFWVESIAEALDTYTQTNQDYVMGFRFYRGTFGLCVYTSYSLFR